MTFIYLDSIHSAGTIRQRRENDAYTIFTLPSAHACQTPPPPSHSHNIRNIVIALNYLIYLCAVYCMYINILCAWVGVGKSIEAKNIYKLHTAATTTSKTQRTRTQIRNCELLLRARCVLCCAAAYNFTRNAI